MHRTIRSVLVVIAVFGLVAAACSSDDNGGNTGTTGGATGSTSSGGPIWVLLPDTASSDRWEGDDLPLFTQAFEDAGLVTRTKEGRVVSCTLAAQPMKQASAWMARYERFWTEKLDALARYLYQQEELQTWSQPDSPKNPRSRSHAATPSRRKRSGARGPTRRR